MNLLTSSSKHADKRPIIGVFISNIQHKKLKTQSKSFINSYRYIRFIELAKANREAQTTLYFFCKKDVNLDNQKINGTYYNEKRNRWEKKKFPLPDILYDRGEGDRGKGRHIRKQLEKKGTKKINPLCILNKWNVYKRLQKNEETRAYLPFTKLYKEPNDFVNMLKEKDELYVKACQGNSGKGVMLIRKLGEEEYEYSYSRDGKLRIRQVKWLKLLKVVKSYFKGKKFIIQQAIPLLRIDNKIIDLRAEVQRNGSGNLEIASIALRIGQTKSPITNVQSRPTIYLFDEFSSANSHLFPVDIHVLKQRIDTFLIDIYRGMEKAYGRFGEIGIDFGVDQEGNIWLIECNARSAKVAAYLTGNKQMIRRIFLNPLEYARFLNNS